MDTRSQILDGIKKELNNIKNKFGNLNVLITGSTGCGKSSTINALFGQSVAKVGSTPDPETMTISKYDLPGITLWDSPGLGDGIENDKKHAENIKQKLTEKGKDGSFLIDVALILIDGSNRDMGTSFELINKVIIPNIDKDRIIVAINKADAAMGNRYWNFKESKPEPKLQKFLEEKEKSVRDRIKQDTGVDIWPISYSAGFYDEDSGDQEEPYNLLKLLWFLYKTSPENKRIAFVENVNQNSKVWKSGDDEEDYGGNIKKSFWEDIKSFAETGGDLGEEIGEKLGIPKIGRAVGTVGGAIIGTAKKVLSSLWPF